MAKEKFTKEQFKSEPVPITIIIQDVNDNKPIFSQETFYAFATEIINDPSLLPQQIGTFEVKDKDLGIYGNHGLKCFLLGQGSDLYVLALNNFILLFHTVHTVNFILLN